MPLNFPYKTEATPNFGDIPVASFWIGVQGPKNIAPFYFIFDTGADVSSLPVSAAIKLGIDLSNCPEETMSGYEGDEVTVYRSTIKIFLNNKRFIIPCVFTPVEHVPILLGRAGILDRFTITFDGKKKEVRFKEI